MASYRKSFNFRNGLQVDNDNFVINENGLVGIGTSVPSGAILDVYGDAKISGSVTVNNLTVNGTATGAGIAYGDLSVSYNSASGIGTLDYNNTNGTFTFTPPDLSSVGSGITSIGIIENSSLIGVTTNISFPGFGVTISSGIATFTNTRTTASATTGSIGAGTTVNVTITGYPTYALQKIGISSAAWVVLYTDEDSRTADVSRSHLTDPNPGSGVIAEVYTTNTGISTFFMSPGIIGWNDAEDNNIFARVTNNEVSSANITVTLTVLKLED